MAEARTAGERRGGAFATLLVLGGSLGSAGLAAIANWIAANGLGPAGFGLFSLAMAIMTVLQEVGGAALDTAIVRHAAPHARQDSARAEAYFRAGQRLKLAISGALALALLALAHPLAERVFEEPGLEPLIRWMALCLLAANLSTIALARLQSAERFIAHAALRILANALKVVLLGGLLFFGWLSPGAAAMAWTVSFVLAWAAGQMLCRAWRHTAQAHPGDSPTREIAGFAGWVMASGLMFGIHIRTDMLLLGHFGTSEEVGNYAVAWNLMLLLDLITSSLVIALMPRAAKARTAAEVAAIRKGALLMGLGVTVALLPLYLFAGWLIDTLFPGFTAAAPAFRLLFWSSIVVLLVYPLYLGFYAQNRPGKVTFAYGMLAVSSIVVGLVLIPRYGLMGAAATTLIARLIGAVAILAMLALERPAWQEAKADA